MLRRVPVLAERPPGAAVAATAVLLSLSATDWCGEPPCFVRISVVILFTRAIRLFGGAACRHASSCSGNGRPDSRRQQVMRGNERRTQRTAHADIDCGPGPCLNGAEGESPGGGGGGGGAAGGGGGAGPGAGRRLPGAGCRTFSCPGGVRPRQRALLSNSAVVLVHIASLSNHI